MPLAIGRPGAPRYFTFERSPLSSRDVALVTTREVEASKEARALPVASFLESVGVAVDRFATASQVHGKRILALSRPGPQGSGDALVTDRAGIVLSIRTADCAPVFLVDPAGSALGLVHAGWRGAALGIAGDTVRALEALYGVDPSRLWAGIGPAVGPCCYEVGREVFDAFGGNHLTARGDAWMLDLPEAIAAQLRAAGVPDGSIERSGACTITQNDLYVSYRAEHTSDRLFSMLGREVVSRPS